MSTLREALEALANEHWDWKAGALLHRRINEILAAHPETPQAEPDHECDSLIISGNVCPEPCGMRHAYCTVCGTRTDVCAHEQAEPDSTSGSWVCGRCGNAPEAHARSECVYDPIFRHSGDVGDVETSQAEPDVGDAEALTEILLGAYLRRESMSHPAFWAEDSDQRRAARKDADVVMKSGWLAIHDARVRRETLLEAADEFDEKAREGHVIWISALDSSYDNGVSTPPAKWLRNRARQGGQHDE